MKDRYAIYFLNGNQKWWLGNESFLIHQIGRMEYEKKEMLKAFFRLQIDFPNYKFYFEKT